MMRPTTGWLAAGWLLCGCGPAVATEPIGEASDSSGGAGVEGTSSAPEPEPPIEPDPEPEPEPPSNFLADRDAGGLAVECNVWTQDCPLGEKCMPWANDGGNAWNAAKCTPLDPNPDAPGEPCTVEESGVSGVDSCELHTMCWDVDPDTFEGQCVPFCTGSPANPVCDDPDRVCSLSGDGVLILCLGTCDPLTVDCPAGQGCYGLGQAFVCAPDASGDEGAQGDPCEFLTACDPGLSCINAALVPDCTGSAGCCAEHCSTATADPCRTDEGESCVPWFEQGSASPKYETVGVCALPS